MTFVSRIKILDIWSALWPPAEVGRLIYEFPGWKVNVHRTIFFNQALHAMKQVLIRSLFRRGLFKNAPDLFFHRTAMFRRSNPEPLLYRIF